MKIDYNESDELIIYLFNNQYNINLNKEDNIERYLKKIFLKLKNYYDIQIKGYYDVTIYIDNKYGIILKLIKQNLEYYNYFNNQVDMKIRLFYKKFWYLIDDYEFNPQRFNMYEYSGKIYLYPKCKLTKKELAYLNENAIVIYDTDELVNNAKTISFNLKT